MSYFLERERMKEFVVEKRRRVGVSKWGSRGGFDWIWFVMYIWVFYVILEELEIVEPCGAHGTAGLSPCLRVQVVL